eukprot:UN12634
MPFAPISCASCNAPVVSPSLTQTLIMALYVLSFGQTQRFTISCRNFCACSNLNRKQVKHFM